MKWRLKAKGWVFISHSSKDYENVKIVRNYLEENGFSALMFYLKSLEDTKKSKLTQQLIKWEIEERNIFVLCNGKEAKKSPWVQEEIEYVKSFPEKIYVEIDIDKLKYEKCTQLSKLDKLMQRATLFFSYSYEDKHIVDKIEKYLSQNGFQIWNAYKDLSPTDNLQKSLKNAIEKVSKEGVIVVFLSKNSFASKWIKTEIDMAYSLNAKILPIIIDDINIFEYPILSKIQALKLNINDFEKKKIDLLLALRRLTTI